MKFLIRLNIWGPVSKNFRAWARKDFLSLHGHYFSLFTAVRPGVFNYQQATKS